MATEHVVSQLHYDALVEKVLNLTIRGTTVLAQTTSEKAISYGEYGAFAVTGDASTKVSYSVGDTTCEHASKLHILFLIKMDDMEDRIIHIYISDGGTVEFTDNTIVSDIKIDNSSSENICRLIKMPMQSIIS